MLRLLYPLKNSARYQFDTRLIWTPRCRGKLIFLTGNRTPAVYPLGFRYTNGALSAPKTKK
jgi:hypothetical protein